ncbi:hypothetical protein [Pleomorphovibrio marinus]|uniref:hypothetical protein n=1 Tax=Pleomorphovibrio marinus TaxID=2164132 RepID=UPI0013005438|nr:hypothetical protein [Pleomorphovibrio marinus]
MKSYWAVLALIVLSASCDEKKEEETLQQENHFKVGEEKYALHKGVLYNAGMDVDYHQGYFFELILTSNGINFEEQEEGYLEGIGAGDALSFDLYSSSPTHLDQGEYTFTTSRPHPIGTFDWGWYVVGWEESTEEVTEESRINSGKITVQRNNNEYTFQFDLTAENGKKITGHYKGTLAFFDYSASSSTARILPQTGSEKVRFLNKR